MLSQCAGDGLFPEFIFVRQPEFGLHGACGDRVQPIHEGRCLASPDAGRGQVRAGLARAVGLWRLAVLQEEPVQVSGDGAVADPGAGGGGDGLACEAGGQDGGDSRLCSGSQSCSYARSRAWSRRCRSSGASSLVVSAQSKARVSAGIVALFRQARTIWSASAAAA